ncbi:FMN-dependent NADH-azoreductase [Acuticoccus sediminis]|uniref:FMN dependent NADH:quinone oxidoreductase n=1 Tax=Acuticoccus sediminis TaxID=2184697 RepID=A0A8B2NS32_9HYPH|nr:NAD(P)H-dependent oxidoreductase [Acuticoccus sediminis]RAH99933.1 FMN-dependent NADH-azoreductase [Acuticoccus sediminis]
MRVLVINSSADLTNAVSRRIVKAAVERLADRDPQLEIDVRDVAVDPVPHLVPGTISGVRGGAESTAEEAAARALSDTLIDELRAADLVVIGVPMYNFGVPTVLRSWFDHVLRAGETFRYSEAGPEGLLRGKRVLVVESRGGLYSEGPAKVADFQEPYLRQLLGFIGLTDVTFVRAERIGFGDEARDAAIASALSDVDGWVAGLALTDVAA